MFWIVCTMQNPIIMVSKMRNSYINELHVVIHVAWRVALYKYRYMLCCYSQQIRMVYSVLLFYSNKKRINKNSYRSGLLVTWMAKQAFEKAVTGISLYDYYSWIEKFRINNDYLGVLIMNVWFKSKAFLWFLKNYSLSLNLFRNN